MILANLGLSIGIVVILAGVAELYFRGQYESTREKLRESLSSASLCTAPSPNRKLIYTYASGKCGVNTHGYIDKERPLAKPSNVFRIVIIGDSVAQGYEVDVADRFGSVLEGLLNDAASRIDYEVIVLARAGYSTSQEIELLKHEAFEYEPDLIVWSYCLNDPAHPVYHNANGNLGAYYYEPRSHLLGRIGATVFRIRERLYARRCPPDFHELLHCAYEGEIEADLRAISNIAAQNGTPVLFVVHPIHQKGGFREYSLAGIHASLSAKAEAAGLLPCDLLEAFRSFDSADVKVHNPKYYDPWHFNELGHRITAEYIARTIRENQLLLED